MCNMSFLKHIVPFGQQNDFLLSLIDDPIMSGEFISVDQNGCRIWGSLDLCVGQPWIVILFRAHIAGSFAMETLISSSVWEVIRGSISHGCQCEL